MPDLQRQLLALNSGDLRLTDWETWFVADVCWRKPETLTERQVQTVQLLCWRHRDNLPADVVPEKEPKPLGAAPPRRRGGRPA
jgi:hypothetical protein